MDQACAYDQACASVCSIVYYFIQVYLTLISVENMENDQSTQVNPPRKEGLRVKIIPKIAKPGGTTSWQTLNETNKVKSDATDDHDVPIKERSSPMVKERMSMNEWAAEQTINQEEERIFFSTCTGKNLDQPWTDQDNTELIEFRQQMEEFHEGGDILYGTSRSGREAEKSAVGSSRSSKNPGEGDRIELGISTKPSSLGELKESSKEEAREESFKDAPPPRGREAEDVGGGVMIEESTKIV